MSKAHPPELKKYILYVCNMYVGLNFECIADLWIKNYV